MQLQLVRATGEIRQLDQIVDDFTPPMKRVCRHMADAALREMIERMAQQQLADERRRSSPPRRRVRTRRLQTTRDFGILHAG